MQRLMEAEIDNLSICVEDHSAYPFHGYGSELVVYRYGKMPEYYQFETHTRALRALESLADGSRHLKDYEMYRDIYKGGQLWKRNWQQEILMSLGMTV